MNKPSPVLALAFAEDAMALASWAEAQGFPDDAAARLLGSEGMRERGIKGADTLAKRYGPEHFTRLAHRRWGRNVSLPSDKPEA